MSQVCKFWTSEGSMFRQWTSLGRAPLWEGRGYPGLEGIWLGTFCCQVNTGEFLRQQLSGLVRDLNSSLHLQPALMLLPHDYRMVARVARLVGLSGLLLLSIRDREGNKQAR